MPDTRSGARPRPVSRADRRAEAETRRSYERIPYRSRPWTACQPARLETIARLRGLDPAPPDGCRVLELGCGDGGNLVPLAVAHPGSHFVGVDLAPGHVEAARRTTEDLGLRNLALEASTFVDWGRDEPPFDYVIAHGLASWVTPALQGRLLETCRRLLAPNGVAFVSYNTHPGWAMQHAIRTLLRHHNRDVSDVEAAVDRARALLELLVETVPGRETAYRQHLEAIAAVAADPAKRYYFAHEYLEDENHPFYVRDFVDRAAACGLAYLGDADQVDAELDNMPEETRERISARAASEVERMQLLDYVVNRKFRQSLLCHADRRLDEAFDWSRLTGMYVASSLTTEDDPALVASPAPMQFGDRHGRTIELDQPVAKAALVRFAEVSPQPVAFETLLDWAWTRSEARPAPGSEQAEADRLLVALVFGRLFSAGLAEVRASPPCWALEAGERPVASPLVRRAAREARATSSLRHTVVALDDPTVCAVLALLDGAHDRAALARTLAGRADAEQIDTILGLAAERALLCP